MSFKKRLSKLKFAKKTTEKKVRKFKIDKKPTSMTKRIYFSHRSPFFNYHFEIGSNANFE